MNCLRYIDAIASTPLFHSFKRDELIETLSNLQCTIVQCKRGQVLHLLKDTCISLDLILKGKVNMQSIDADGNVLAIHQLSHGEMFGAGLIFAQNNRYPMMSLAETNATILRLSKDSILFLCRQNIEFTLALLQEVSDRTAIMTERMHSIAYKSIRQRLMDYFEKEYRLQGSRTIILPISQKKIALQFGVQRQSLSRELNKMRAEGLLEYKNRTIELHERFK